MKFSQFFSAQRIIKQILDWVQTSKSEAIEERFSDLYTDGVLELELNSMAILGKDNFGTLTDFFHIKVDTGVAYKNGERIAILDSSLTYDLTAPTHTTNDGLGNFLLTPQSTGSFDISLTTGFINYIWIAYLQTTDDTQFTLHRLNNSKQFYKRTDGYEIQITTINTNPDPSRFINLGEVNLLGSNQAITSNISLTSRDICREQLRRVMIETSNNVRTDRPAVYSDGQQKYFLDDHIKAVGTAAITPTNPHGTSLSDIGVTANETVEEHRKIEHTNGLITATAAPTISGVFGQRVQVSPGDDYILVKALLPNEFLVVYGVAYDITVIPVDIQINFSLDPNGTYSVYFDSVTKTFNKTLLAIDTDTTKFIVCSVVWDGTSIPGDGNLSVPLDKRRFGTNNLLQRWYTVGRPPTPLPGTFGYNLDTNLPEYFDGSTWNNL